MQGRISPSGYARGVDFKLNGEFVPGAESWMTLSLLQTREDVEGDFAMIGTEANYVQKPAGEFPRPTDQLFTFGLYFQDYFPNQSGLQGAFECLLRDRIALKQSR